MNLQEARKRIPELEGLSDESALGVIQQVYYPDMDRATLAGALGYKMPEPPAPDRTWGAVAKDVGVSALKGAIAVPEAFVGMADLLSGGVAGKALEDAGFRPGDAKAILNDQYSDKQKQAFQAVSQADGFMGKMGAALANPSVIGHTLVESAPLMGMGGVIGRGVTAVAPKVSGVLAGAIGEGAVGAGSSAEGIRQATPDGTLSMNQSALAGASGALTGAFTLLGGKVAQKLGIADVDTMLASAAANPAVRKGVVRSALEGAVSEGVLEELPQSVQEQVLQNAALGKPLDEGVDQAAVMGLLSGMAMGGGANAVSGFAKPPAQQAADAIRAAETVPESGPMTRSVNAGTEAKAQAVEAGAPLVDEQAAAEPMPEPVDDPVRDQILALPDGARQDALRAYAVVNRDDVAKGVQQYNRKLLDRLLSENAPSPVLGESLTGTDMGTMLGGGGMAGNADPVAGMLGGQRDSTANAMANVEQAAQSRPPMPASDAARMLDEARNRGLDLAVAEHPSGGFVILPPAWVTPEMAAQGQARLADTIARMQQADAAPVERAPRASSAPVDLSLPTDPVQNYVGNLRSVNTPAARAYVRDFDAGRITPAQVQQRMTAEQGKTPDQLIAQAAAEAPAQTDPVADRLARAAAQGMALPAPTDILNPSGLPFKTQMAAKLAAKKKPGAVIPVDGGFVVRPQEPVNVQDVPQASEVPETAPAVIQPSEAPQAVGAQPAGPAAGVPAEGAGAVEAAGVERKKLLDSLNQSGATREMVLDTRLSDAEYRLQQAIAAPNVNRADQKARVSEITQEIASLKDVRADAIELDARDRREGGTRSMLRGARQELDAAVRAGTLTPEDAQSIASNAKNTGNAADASEAIFNAVDSSVTGAAVEAAGVMQESGQKVPQDQAKKAPEATETVAQPTAQPVGDEQTFAPETGTLGIPRAEMPQVPTQSHGGLVKHLNAQGIEHETTMVDAAGLKPTQAEFSPSKVEAAKDATGDRAVIVSNDGHIIDGHHQALAAAEEGKPVKAIVLDAPVEQALEAVKASPSAQPKVDSADAPAAQPITRAAVDAARQQAATAIAQRIDAMTAQEVQKVAARFLPTMGVKPVRGKANIRTAMVDPKVNLQAAADEVGAVLADDVKRALQADGEGRVEADDATKSEAASARPQSAKEDSGVSLAPKSIKPIEDAGEKIGGARKDRWKERGLDLEDLNSMTEAEGAELATKANVWKPDYEAISEASEPVTAAMVKAIYDQLAAKPKKNTPEGRRQYVQMMRIVRDVLTEAKGPEDVKNAYVEIRKRAGLNTLDPKVKADGRELLFSVYKGRSDPFVLGFNELQRVKKMVADGFPAKAAPWKTRLVVGRAEGGPGTTERGIEIYMERAAEVGTPLTREQILDGFYRVSTKENKAVAFAASKADAEAAAATVYERDMKGKKDGKPEPVRPNLDELKRENLPKRIDRDVKADDFVNDLGFRGIEFGNWSAQDERQRILNMAYDGLMDLAEIMGVPPKAMSLNGTLGMAFGARGGGRFAAHYEPGKLVINMTKIRGGGSMAHEWAHAMDHYFGELDKPDAYTTQARGASGWYSEDQYNGVPRKRMERVGGEWKNVEKMRLDNLRPEMAAAFDEVMQALFQKQITKAEMVRSHELDLERSEALARKEQDAGLKAMYQNMVQNKRQALNELRGDPEGKMYAGRGRTDYANQAQALSGKSTDGYWVRPTEMFARAFESWVFDRVTAMGARSDYLVHGVEEDRFAGGAYKGNPYPTGEERARINAAFDKLAQTIKTKETDKGVAMFSRAPGGMSAEEAVAMFNAENPVRTDTRSADRRLSDARLVATQQLVEHIKEKWTRAPEIIVARNMQDSQIPQRVREHDATLKSQGSTGEARGFIYQRKVYLLADELSAPSQIAEVLFHEVLGHYGLRGVFGDSLTPILKQIAALRRADVQAKAKEYGFDLTNERDRLSAAEEVLAEMAQSTPELGYVKRAIAAIRTWLRENVPGFKNLALTDAEIIRSYILPARGYVTRSDETPQQSLERAQMAFSRQAEPSSALAQEVDAAIKAGMAGDTQALRAQVPVGIVTPPALQLLGVASRPVYTHRDLIAKMHFEHGVPRSALNGLDKLLSEPAMIFQSDTRPGRFVVVTSLVVGSNPVVVAVDPNGKSGRAEVVYLPSAYPKDNADRVFSRWIRDGLLKYADKKESRQLATTARLQLPGVVQRAIGFDVDYKTEADLPATDKDAGQGADESQPMFSRASVSDAVGAAIKAVTVANVKKRAGFKLTDYLGIGLQALGRRQIVDIYGDLLPLAEYNRLVQQMEADKNEGGAEADQLVTQWAKLPDEGKLADLMHDATLAQIDPAVDFVDGDDKGQYLSLQRKYNLLSADAKKVYADTRDAYKAHHAKVRSAIKERIERSEIKGERKAALLKQMDDEFFKAVKGVYFPLARFGQYVVTVKGADGKVESVSRAETKAEAEALRGNLLSAFPRDKGFTVGRVILGKEFIANRDVVGRGFMTELYQVLDKQDMDAAQRAELEDTLGQLYLSSLPDLSWAKHGIHRKGTPGFSQDARRAYAQNMFHGARYLAKLRYSDLMQDELVAMQKHVDDWRDVEDFDQNSAQRVVDEMNKRHESLMNPQSNALSTALTSLGFVFHLGLSPASAMVNLSQTALVAYPIMGAKWGYGKASAALLKASAEAAKGKNDITASLNEDERAAYDEAVRAGTIDVTMAHDLAGIAQGEDAGVMWKIRPVMRWASFLFHHAERFNRQVTFVAAYRLAREAGADHKTAFEQATKATYDGHFDYGAANRPRVMQGNMAKVLLLFKQYGQNMVYTLARNAQQAIKGETPEARAQARKALGGLLVTHASAAGVLGLPMVTTLLAAASMIGGDDDEPWDAKVALQNMLADAFGQKPAEVLAHGLSRLTPWDISGRVGLDRLIFPDVQEGLEGQRLGESAMAAALGPVAGIGINVLKGVQLMGEGRYALGLEAMMPSALRGPVKAIRYANEGVQDKSGISILDEVSPAAVVGQALGFSPSEARGAQEGKSAVMALDRTLGDRRKELLTRAARATMEKDAEARIEAMKEIDRFNQKNPTRRITPLNVLQSARNRQKRIDQAEGGIYLPKNRRDAMDAGRFAVAE